MGINKVNDELISTVRSVVGVDYSEMDIIRALHMAKNDPTAAINIIFDAPSFKKSEIPKTSKNLSKNSSSDAKILMPKSRIGSFSEGENGNLRASDGGNCNLRASEGGNLSVFEGGDCNLMVSEGKDCNLRVSEVKYGNLSVSK
ncbi:hypothetical protein Leryth_013897, partial [Lithospermum erythrorhizon]